MIKCAYGAEFTILITAFAQPERIILIALALTIDQIVARGRKPLQRGYKFSVIKFLQLSGFRVPNHL